MNESFKRTIGFLLLSTTIGLISWQVLLF